MKKQMLKMMVILMVVGMFVYLVYTDVEEPWTPSQDMTPIVSEKEEVRKQVTFEYLRQWKPHNAYNGFGADILLQQDLSEQELIAFVRYLAGSYNPVIIRIWLSRIAYQDEYAKTPEFKTDYLLFYVKNMTSRGPFRGCNEIRWMQQIGKFSSKYKTKF